MATANAKKEIEESQEVKVIKRNIYLNKKFNTKDKDHGIFCSCSLSPASSTLCGSDCSCRIVLSSCSASCECRCDCTNKPFQQRRIKKMKLVQTEKCGYGIVVDEDINAGEFIIEYVGEVIDKKICEERLRKMEHKEETNFYLCQVNSNMVIDATYKGNNSRYINHSCDPNAEMQKWVNDGETRIGIFAIRYISKGEALTYDYQFVQFGADQDCYCGAVCCRKKLGAKVSKSKTKPSDEAVNQTSCTVTRSPNCIGVVIMLERPTNERCFGIIREFDEYSRKHLVMFEDGGTERIDLSKEVWKLIND